MTKKINILLTPEDIAGLYQRMYKKSVLAMVTPDDLELAKEQARKMWTRLIELGIISEHHDCTNWERTGHSPDHSPFCRWCRIKKELGLI